MLDLILRDGHVWDPSQGIDAPMDVGFADGKVAALAPHIDTSARQEKDVRGLIVAPGFIDMHTHVYWGATSISIRGEDIARRAAVTTMVDAGSAGPGNFAGLRHYVIERSSRRTLAFINVAYPGIFAYSRPVMVGECSDLRLIDQAECVRVVEENRDVIVGIKVRIGKVAGGDTGCIPLDLGIEVAEQLGMPLMVHIDHSPPHMREILSRLRPGDMLTHCLRPFPNTMARPDGGIIEAACEARARGVLFDLGHGASSFSFEVARTALVNDFLPDFISTDIHVLNVDGPVFDLMTTMTKFLALGVEPIELVRRVTATPAAGLRRPELGTFAVGAAGDATLFVLEDGRFQLKDCFGAHIPCSRRFAPRGVVLKGAWFDH
ncbi:MAG TPA: amidohydrolase/deacetylase family metallohydrolase [Bradyrhizobium sp.]|nr:amidohydrolase/deacetylase family metallohydrolase [Bradyrhizobium sp.]